jgi:hypothetical protein
MQTENQKTSHMVILSVSDWQKHSFIIPGMLSVPSSEGMQLSMTSCIILALTFIAGYIGTERWWRYADHV